MTYEMGGFMDDKDEEEPAAPVAGAEIVPQLTTTTAFDVKVINLNAEQEKAAQEHAARVEEARKKREDEANKPPPPEERCRTCRHHTKDTRDRVVNYYVDDDEEFAEVHDGSPEDVEMYGEKKTEDVFSCTKQNMIVIGVDDDAGHNCPMWEAGKKTKAALSPELERRLRERFGP